ncbi:MAG: hypothetical protein M1813_009770 [Trichoglossum hirsutum]|nr:MAG: hypothetical protein M1813_009770 [Trichoglossum hirsutum]
MPTFEMYRPHGSTYSFRRRKPRDEEPERHQTVIVEPPEPHMNFAEDISNLCNNQHVIHQRIDQIGSQQERLISTSEKLLRREAKQAQKIDNINHELQYRARVHTRPEPLYLREREFSYIKPAETLLLGSEADYRHRHYRSASMDRADRAYICDGMAYVRHGRRPTSQSRYYAESDGSSDSASSMFDYEPPRRIIRRPVIHQQACECGGIGYHLMDCPRRSRY